jgi:hypothetical protein
MSLVGETLHFFLVRRGLPRLATEAAACNSLWLASDPQGEQVEPWAAALRVAIHTASGAVDDTVASPWERTLRTLGAPPDASHHHLRVPSRYDAFSLLRARRSCTLTPFLVPRSRLPP